MTSIYNCSPAYTMVDKSKGSFTNRAQCAKEQFVNNLKMGAQASLIAGVPTATVLFAPKASTKIATKTGELLAKLPGLKNIIKNPTKAGKIGILTALGIGLYNVVANGIYKAGQIDQKYTDSAKIESQTKNVILKEAEPMYDDHKCVVYG